MIRSFLGESRLIIVRINYRLKRTKNQSLHAQISERNQHIGLDGEIVVNKPSEILGHRTKSVAYGGYWALAEDTPHRAAEQ